MNTSSYIKRSLSDQTGTMRFNLDVSIDSLGACEFGFSGDTVLKYSLNSGRFYNKGQFVHSYNIGDVLQISGNINTGTYDTYLNNLNAGIGFSKTHSELNYFYFSPTGVTVSFDLDVYGLQPRFTYSTGLSYYSGQLMTGSITNNYTGTAFRVFSGSIDSFSSNYSLVSYSTGDITGVFNFVISGSGFADSIDYVPVIFKTNFGDLSYNLGVTGLTGTTDSIALYPTSGIISSGSYNVYTGIYVFEPYTVVTVRLNVTGAGTGVWNLYSGYNGLDYVDFKTNGLFTASAFLGSGISGVNNANTLFIQVYHNGNVGDTAQLVISGNNTGAYQWITGV